MDNTAEKKFALMNGLIVLDKPAGITSARAVSRVKRLLPRGTKIGHAGTLDPFATGVLLLLVGRATKLCESLMDQPKQYDATIRFGATTATDDPESPPICWPHTVASDSPPSEEYIITVLAHFQGEIKQAPPAFSALKVSGRRAYDLARQGVEVKLIPRTVVIYGIQLMEYVWPDLRLRIDCGRGTYIRAIARDLGVALNVGAYLTQLRRTRIGQFRIEAARTLEQLTAQTLESDLIPVGSITP
jgi:tRNA pseudouridine55 synthase